MPKKNAPKKSAKKPAPAAKAKAKPVPKPAAKAAPAKGKPAVAAKGGKGVVAPVAKGKAGKVVPAAPAKNAKSAAPAVAAKGAKAPKVDHAVQKGLLNKHRDEHHQGDALDVKVRPKLQFYTLADLKAYLDRRSKSKSKLNVWVPDEERKARE